MSGLDWSISTSFPWNTGLHCWWDGILICFWVDLIGTPTRWRPSYFLNPFGQTTKRRATTIRCTQNMQAQTHGQQLCTKFKPKVTIVFFLACGFLFWDQSPTQACYPVMKSKLYNPVNCTTNLKTLFKPDEFSMGGLFNTSLAHLQGDLERCVPFFLHLDEGTGLRKSAVLIYSAQTIFGAETAKRFEEFFQGNVRRDHNAAFETMSRAQFHSARGSTYKSRYLFTCLPKRWYSKKNARNYDRVLQILADECLDLFAEGLQIAGETFFFICLGLKADQPAQAKAGKFCRSFANMGRNKGCCFECLAGLDQYPFEEVCERPRFLRTIDTVVPWDPHNPSPLLSIPHRTYQSATFFKRDPFHLYKQSIGGHYVASSIVLLMDFGFFNVPGAGNSVEALFERASFDFAYWARTEWRGAVRPHMKHFTRQLFHYMKTTKYPFLRCKGSDMMLLTRWIRYILERGVIFEGDLLRSGQSLLATCRPDQRPLLQAMHAAASGALTFFSILHGQGLWLHQSHSAEMAASCLRFCKAYTALAVDCHGLRLTRFHFEPSLHGFLHFFFDLQGRSGSTLNPAIASCEADEDYVGKIARLARCVHAGTTTIRVIERLLIKTYFELEEPNLWTRWLEKGLKKKIRGNWSGHSVQVAGSRNKVPGDDALSQPHHLRINMFHDDPSKDLRLFLFQWSWKA